MPKGKTFVITHSDELLKVQTDKKIPMETLLELALFALKSNHFESGSNIAHQKLFMISF